MKTKSNNPIQSQVRPSGIEMTNTPGYPSYPEGEDIDRNYTESEEIDPENIFQIKTINTDDEYYKHEIFRHTGNGDDMDVPGSELDDELEDIGSEDEENNYYSLGGDDHNDLDEYKGELE